MAKGNKPKYLPLIPSLELDNTKTYTHVDIAIKLGTRHFDREKKTQNAICQALARADESLKRGEAHPGWKFKRLASSHFPDWDAEWALIQLDLVVEPQEAAEPAQHLPEVIMEPVVWVTLPGLLEAVAILFFAITCAYFRYQEDTPTVPLPQAAVEEQYITTTGASRHAAYHELETGKEPNYMVNSFWISLRIMPR